MRWTVLWWTVLRQKILEPWYPETKQCQLLFLTKQLLKCINLLWIQSPEWVCRFHDMKLSQRMQLRTLNCKEFLDNKIIYFPHPTSLSKMKKKMKIIIKHIRTKLLYNFYSSSNFVQNISPAYQTETKDTDVNTHGHRNVCKLYNRHIKFIQWD